MEPIYQLIRREREGDQIDICMAIGGAKAKQFGKWSVNRDLTYIIYYCICQKTIQMSFNELIKWINIKIDCNKG